MKSIKIEIRPGPQQRKQFAMAFGTARWCYNWALDQYFKASATGQHLTRFKLDPMLNNLRQSDPTNYGWISNVNTMIKSEALKDFDMAIEKYQAVQHRSRRSRSAKVGFNAAKGKPSYRTRKNPKQSFRLFRKADSTFKVVSNHHFNFNWTSQYGRMSVRTVESIEFLKHATIKLATFTRERDRYYLSLTYEINNQKPKHCGTGTVGLDLGVKHVVVTYDGSNAVTYDLPSTMTDASERTQKCQEKLSHKHYGSKAYVRQKLALEKCYAHEANIRKDFLHKLTTNLVKSYDTIKVDDFSFKKFVRLRKGRFNQNNRNMNRKAYAVAPCMLKSMLEYKSAEYGVKLQYVPIGTPTTQTCSACNCVRTTKVTLSERTFVCNSCGFTADRDTNSAINVYKLKIIN